MRVKLFTFRYSPTLGGFDDTALSEFTKGRTLLSFREYLFSVNAVPHVFCALTYQDVRVGPEEEALAREIPARDSQPSARTSRRAPGGDPTAGLNEAERLLFNELRDWRARKAHEEGVPPYLVFTNRHLIEIVRGRPESPTALGNLKGIGPGKLKRYAAEVLGMLSGAARDTAPAAPKEGPA